MRRHCGLRSKGCRWQMARTLPNPTLLFFLLTVLGAVYQAMLSLEEAHEALIEVWLGVRLFAYRGVAQKSRI
jgi:hypothetical protein